MVGRLRQFYFVSIFMSTIFISFIPVLTIDLIDNGYVLILYYDGEEVDPGDYVIIKAELFLGGKRIDNRNNINIELFLGMPPPDNLNVQMEYGRGGIYTYYLIIPQNYLGYRLPVFAYAFLDEVEVATASLYIGVEEFSFFQRISPRVHHSLSHNIIKPNETLQITSFLPEVENNTIHHSNVAISINISILLTELINGLTALKEHLNGTLSEVKPIYCGYGNFKANYTVPANISDESIRLTGNLQLHVVIKTLIIEELFVDHYLLEIDDFYIITSIKMDNNSIILKIIALDDNFLPLKGVNWNITLPHQSIDLNPLSVDPTDEEGVSNIIMKPDIPIESLTLDIVGIKDSKVAFLNNIYVSKSNFFWHEKPTGFFNIIPNNDNFERQIHYNDKGMRGSYFALHGNKPIKNKELYLYLYWCKGVISVSKIKTDKDGLFYIKKSWPENMSNSIWDSCSLRVLYHNGTTWIRGDVPNSIQFFKFPFEFTINNVIKPITEINEYLQYRRVNLTWEVPINSSIHKLTLYPVYKYSPISENIFGIPNRFSGYTPFQNSYLTLKRDINKINYITFIDEFSEIDHLIIEGIMYPKDLQNDFKYH